MQLGPLYRNLTASRAETIVKLHKSYVHKIIDIVNAILCRQLNLAALSESRYHIFNLQRKYHYKSLDDILPDSQWAAQII